MSKALKTGLPVVVMLALIAAAMLVAPPAAQRIAYAVERGKQDAARTELIELSKHDQLSALFRAVSKAVKPAVVEVRVTRWIETVGPETHLRRFFNEENSPFRFRFRSPEGDRGERRVPKRTRRRIHGLGSGVIVDAENGYILTNYHVVGTADEVEVVLADGRKFDAQWVRTDPQTDLAVIRIASDRLVEAPLGDSDKAQVGDWVLAIGAPKALPQTVTAGIISAKGRYKRTPALARYRDFIQTDAAINRGNSGGPLVNMRGEVIGLSNYIVSSSGGNEGLGFAIPSNMVRNIMDQLIGKGKVVRGFLGVGGQDVDQRAAASLNLPDTSGVVVTAVVEDGPAEKAGIKIEDVIVAVNGKKTTNWNELRNVVAGIAPAETVKVKMYRGGKKLTLEVKLGPQPAWMAMRPGGWDKTVTPGEKKLGIRAVTMTEELAKKYGYDPEKPVKGAVITEVEEGSDAEEQGLREGLVVTHVQGKRIETGEEFVKGVADPGPDGTVRLRVVDPKGGSRMVFIKPGKS